ncbi:KilA-N domain-containing protein [Microcoleus sp. herbarium7]|uniref:KilA-N domain-containing protein n=1 Tax=Microcoleus sp. herbarium7 TaxID=3055435 RepID=UPI002FD266FE
MNILAHSFNEIGIPQSSEDSTIGGKDIPKGYVNATQMCKAGKKKLNDWTRLKRSIAYLEALSLATGIPASSLSIELQGTPDGDASLQGTWVHPKVAISIAAWISPELEVWASDALLRVINGEFEALTAEAKEAQKGLDALWQKVRADGKVTRRTLTDAIRDWYIKNPNATTCPQHSMYANTTNAIYQALWGMTALEIEGLLGCERNQLRNHISKACLKDLERAECRVMEFIDYDSIKPIDAVFAADVRKSRARLS